MPQPQPQYDYQKVGEVRDLLASLDADTLADAFVAHYADHATHSALARKAVLAKMLPHLNARLEDEAQGLLDFQKSVQDEDAVNAKERALGRAFNAEMRRQERAAMFHHLKLLEPELAPEGADQHTKLRHKYAYERLTHKLEEALVRYEHTGRLAKQEPQPRRVIPPRRNYRREELARRTALIKELTQFCEVVESVVAGTHIVDDGTLADLITRARSYIGANNQEPTQSCVEYDESQEYHRPLTPQEERDERTDWVFHRGQNQWYAEKELADQGLNPRFQQIHKICLQQIEDRFTAAEERNRAAKKREARGQSP